MSDEQIFHNRAKAYIRFVLEEFGMTPSALAKAAGLAPTTITRALNDPDHKFTLSMKTLEKISRGSGINFAPFFDRANFADLALMPYESQDEVYDKSWELKPRDVSEENNARTTVVIGDAAVGVWKEEQVARTEESGFLSLTIPGARPTAIFALRMADDSAAPSVLKGEFALCLRTKRDLGQLDFNHGDLVVVERWTSNHALMELSIRRVNKRDGHAPYLECENADRPYSERLSFPTSGIQNTDDMKIVGQLLAAVRPIWKEMHVIDFSGMEADMRRDG